MGFNQESTDDALRGPSTGGAGGSPGKLSTTSRLAPRAQQIVFRVESPEAAAVLADRFGPRDGNGVAAGAGEVVDRASSSSGSPLPDAARTRFEGSLGAELSAVRVHTGAASADAAGAVGARAYTTGNDIHFGAGQYAPADPFGLHLLAHEVAHTQQQAGSAPTTQYKLAVSSPGDAAEVEADRAADAMVQGAPAAVAFGAGVQRTVMRDASSKYETQFGSKTGGANALEAAGTQAAVATTDGLLAPATISTTWAETRSTQMTTWAAELAGTEFIGDTGKAGTDNPGYKVLVSEAGEYTTDVVRLGLAESLYNQIVEPANLGTVAARQLRGAAAAMGFKEDAAAAGAAPGKSVTSIGDDLGGAQKDELAKLLGKTVKKVDGTKDFADAQANFATEDGATHTTTLQAIDNEIAVAQQKVKTEKGKLTAAVLAVQSVVIGAMTARQTQLAAAAAGERDKLLTEIKAISDAAKNMTKILQVAGSVGFGMKGAIEDVAFNTAKDKGTEIATDPAGLVGAIAEEIATASYDAQLKDLESKIDSAKGSIASLAALGVELDDDVKKKLLGLAGEALHTATIEWAKLLGKRRELLIVKSKAGDAKATPGKQGPGGDKIAQVAVLLNDAKDARSTLELGQDTAADAGGAVAKQAKMIDGHRANEIPDIQPGVGDKKSWKMLPQKVGPDQSQLHALTAGVTAWSKHADQEIAYADKVEISCGLATNDAGPTPTTVIGGGQ